MYATNGNAHLMPENTAPPMMYPNTGGMPVTQPMAVAQPIGQPAMPVAMAQPIGQPPMAMAQPVGQPPVAAMATPIAPAQVPVMVVQQQVPGSQIGTPQMMSRDIDAFGFVCKDNTNIHNAKSLAGLYVSCFWWFCPAPCFVCRRFTAPDDDTVALSNGCCLGCPVDCNGEQFRRNWDENQQPGPPNSFSSAQDTMEFGAFNGLCAGSASTTCYLRVC